MIKKIFRSLHRYVQAVAFLLIAATLFAQQSTGKITNLTLDSVVDMAMRNSYQIRQLELQIERTRYRLKSQRAALKSSVYMNLRAPEFTALSEYKWNSSLKRDEIIRENSQLWQMDLTVKQPVVLFGYPTNGYLSLNYMVYRYFQNGGASGDINYYNRYFVKFEQPLFTPNRLRNDIEVAELELEENELEYLVNRVELIDNIAVDYYRLVKLAWRNEIYSDYLERMKRIETIADNFSMQDSTRRMDALQVRIVTGNAQETLLGNRGDLRSELSKMKQRLRLSQEDSVHILLTEKIYPVNIEPEEAIRFASTISPELHLIAIQRRMNEINLQESRGRDAFQISLEMTYGLENEEDRFRRVWDNYHDSYSVLVNAYIPIWDWGRRKARIEAKKINLLRTDLRNAEKSEQIRNEITDTINRLKEFEIRSRRLSENMKTAGEISEQSIRQYEIGSISIQELFQILDRERETALNFLEAYLGYRHSLLSLMINTYYDFENGRPLTDRFSENETLPRLEGYTN